MDKGFRCELWGQMILKDREKSVRKNMSCYQKVTMFCYDFYTSLPCSWVLGQIICLVTLYFYEMTDLWLAAPTAIWYLCILWWLFFFFEETCCP